MFFIKYNFVFKLFSQGFQMSKSHELIYDTFHHISCHTNCNVKHLHLQGKIFLYRFRSLFSGLWPSDFGLCRFTASSFCNFCSRHDMYNLHLVTVNKHSVHERHLKNGEFLTLCMLNITRNKFICICTSIPISYLLIISYTVTAFSDTIQP